MGFIGRNGAGKTTTLKCIMNLVHYESGKIYAFDTDMNENELENKQRIGFALSELNYYPNKTIRQLMNVTKRFYKNFDEHKFNEACRLFNLNLDKKLEELSIGTSRTPSSRRRMSQKKEAAESPPQDILTMGSLGIDVDHFAVAAQMVLFAADFLDGGGAVLKVVNFLLKRAVFPLHAVQVGTEAENFLLGTHELPVRGHDEDD